MINNHENFKKKAPNLVRRLMEDFKLNKIQAAAILGNIGHECNGFLNLREIGQKEGKGGYGWCQWTGVRRLKFLEFCKSANLDYTNDAANYDYLYLELMTTEQRAIHELLQVKDDLVKAVQIFERSYERAGVINLKSRVNYAKIALQAYESVQ